MMIGKQSSVRHGTCELCGGHDRDLRILVLQEFIGWACGECIRQIGDCMPRKFSSSGEHTEPSE